MGRLARDGLHPDQAPDTPIGVWCDAAWSAFTDVLLAVSAEQLDALTTTWEELTGPAPAEVAAAPEHDDEPAGPGERRGPTEAEKAAWGTSKRAQAGAAGLAAMMGGMPGAGG